LAEAAITVGAKPLIMFGILGSEWYKSYPFENMAKIIDFTVEQLDANILFNYIPAQKEDALKIYNFCAEKPKLISTLRYLAPPCANLWDCYRNAKCLLAMRAVLLIWLKLECSNVFHLFTLGR